MQPSALLSGMKPVTLADAAVFEKYYARYSQSICEATFAERFLWGTSRQHLWTEHESHLLVSYQKRGDERFWYAPVGPYPVALIKQQRTPAEGFRYRYVPEDIATALDTDFRAIETPENFDYVFDVAALRTLEGKHYAEKRNFINRARKLDPKVTILNAASKAACIDLLHRWGAEQSREGQNSLLDEESALLSAMENFEALKLFGIGISINNRLEAFSFGCPLSATTFVEYFEKASDAFQGLYPLAVHELCNALPSNFTELNLEEDLGIPGLRIAKQRWNPKHLVKKYAVEWS